MSRTAAKRYHTSALKRNCLLDVINVSVCLMMDPALLRFYVLVFIMLCWEWLLVLWRLNSFQLHSSNRIHSNFPLNFIFLLLCDYCIYFFISLYIICKEEYLRISCSEFWLYSYIFISISLPSGGYTTTSLDCSHPNSISFSFAKINHEIRLMLPTYIWVGATQESVINLLWVHP